MTDEEYLGLFGEVVTADVYRIRELTFTPDLVFDIGANVGVFAHFARSLWPDAKIVCVEPHPANFEQLENNRPMGDTVLINAAIGDSGPVVRAKGAVNGAHEAYLSPGLGYEVSHLEDESYELTDVEVIAFSEVFFAHYRGDDNPATLLKLDCEGGENSMCDLASIAALTRSDYICAELHFHAAHGGLVQEVRRAMFNIMADLTGTHTIEYNHPMLWARKRHEVKDAV